MITKDTILARTNYGTDIYAHILRQFCELPLFAGDAGCGPGGDIWG